MRTLPILFALGLLAAPVLASDAPPAPPAPPPVSPPDRPTTPEVHKVYVPYRDLAKVFEKEGQGVFLPYAEFKALWAKAYETPRDPTAPPVAAALRSAVYAGVAEGEGIRFTAQIEVEVLAKGWQRVALDFGGVGIERATIGGEPALLLPTPKGYDLLLEGPRRVNVDLTLRAAAPAAGDTRSAELALPAVPLARLSLRVPGTDTEVQVEPRLAGSAGPGAEGTTEFLAFLGPTSKVRLTWRRRPEEREKLAPLVFAHLATDVLVDRGVVRTEATAALSLLRAPLETLTLAVPADAVVLYVEGPGIRTWERNAAGDRIEVALREPVKEAWTVRVGLERPVPPLPAVVALPLVGVEGAERDAGFLRLRAAEGVKLEPGATPGLLQIDLTDLPAPLLAVPPGAGPGKVYAWRHAARPGIATVAVEALAPRVAVALGQRVGLRPEGIEVRATAQFTVERAGVFGAAFDLPAALEVGEVNVTGAELDDWTRVVAPDGSAILRIAFRDRLLGTATILVAGRLPFVVAEAQGQESAVDVPLLRVRDAQLVRGYLAVHADPALDRRETARAGLTVLEADTPAVLEPGPLPDPALPLALRFEHRETPPSLSLRLKRKAATVTGAVQTALRLEPDRTRVEVHLLWTVQFRGVARFAFRGPASWAGRVHLGPRQPGTELAEAVLEPRPEGAPADWAPSYATWTLTLAAPREGRIGVVLAIDDQPETPLAAGSSRRVALPVFVPVGETGAPLENTTFHAAVRRDPLLEVETERVEHGEEIDARELEATTGLAGPETFLAFRSYDPAHAVTLRVTKHEFEPVAEVVVSHMHLNTVIPEEGRATTEAFLVVRNNDRQYLELRLPPEANIRAVSVDGKPETPRRGEDGAVRIPLLANLRKDQAFLVAFVYDHDVERGGVFFRTVGARSPEPLRVHGDLLTWRVHVPKDREYTAFGGDVTRERAQDSWAFRLLDDATGLMRRAPTGRPLDLARMVADLEKGSPFQVQSDGTTFLFGNRTGTGTVTLTSANPKAFLFLRLALLVAGFLGARRLVRLLGRRGVGPLSACAVPALLVLLLLVPAGPGWTAVLTAILAGVLASGVVSFLGWIGRGSGSPPAPPTSSPPPTPPTPPASPTPPAPMAPTGLPGVAS